MARFRKVAYPDGTVERIPLTDEEVKQRDAEEAIWVEESTRQDQELQREKQRTVRRTELLAKQKWTPAELEEAIRLALSQ